MAEHDTEPALIYDAGERRTHGQHAAEAYDFAKRADDLRAMVKSAESCDRRAQWHATMAVYEATNNDRAPLRVDCFSHDEREVIAQALAPMAALLFAPADFTRRAQALLAEFSR